MKRLLLVLVCAACGHHDHPAISPDAAAAADAPLVDATADAGADAAPDGCATCWQIPPPDLGMITITGSCDYVSHGWSFDDATGCSPTGSSGTTPTTRQITIAQMGTGYAVTTFLRNDPLTGMPYDYYTVDLSEAQPTATYGTPPGCDPIYGTCIEHDWTLAAHSLDLATHGLHDNWTGSSAQTTQCWEYSYFKSDCTFTITW